MGSQALLMSGKYDTDSAKKNYNSPYWTEFKNGGYVSIPKHPAYNFETNPFSVMAYIIPKKDASGSYSLTEGTLVSSKPAPGGTGCGGWQFFLEIVNGVHYVCFKIDDGHGYHLLRAPLNNLYDNHRFHVDNNIDEKSKKERLKQSQQLFTEYVHFVVAVKEADNTLKLYVNGYLLASSKAESGTDRDVKSFTVKAIYKDAINTPTHFFTLKKTDFNTYALGYSDWNSDQFVELNSGFSLNNNSYTVFIDDEKLKKDLGVSAIRVQKIEGVKPGAGMILSVEYVLSVIPSESDFEAQIDSLKVGNISANTMVGKVLTQFLASRTVINSLNNYTNIRIGSHEQFYNPYEGYIKHVSLWNRALNQNEIVRFLDHESSEWAEKGCIGFWLLQSDCVDLSINANHASVVGTLECKAVNIVLPTYIENQLKSNWCWAATALSIVEYYAPLDNLTQNNIVMSIYNEEANNGGLSKKYLESFTNYIKVVVEKDLKNLKNALIEKNNNNIDNDIITTFKINDKSLKIDESYLLSEIQCGRPIAAAVKWWNGKDFNSGHEFVINGYNEDKLLIINDPWNGVTYITFDQLLTSYSGNGHLYNLSFTKAHKNILYKEEEYKIIKGNYALVYQTDGNLAVYKILDPNKSFNIINYTNCKFISGTAIDRSGRFIDYLEFTSEGDTIYHFHDGSISKLSMPESMKKDSKQYDLQLDFIVNDDDWDVVIRDTSNDSEFNYYSILTSFIRA